MVCILGGIFGEDICSLTLTESSVFNLSVPFVSKVRFRYTNERLSLLTVDKLLVFGITCLFDGD